MNIDKIPELMIIFTVDNIILLAMHTVLEGMTLCSKGLC